MAASTRYHEPPDRRLTSQARLSGALVDVVTQVKESFIAFDIDIVAYRGAA
jgi:hypothetical protein